MVEIRKKFLRFENLKRKYKRELKRIDLQFDARCTAIEFLFNANSLCLKGYIVGWCSHSGFRIKADPRFAPWLTDFINPVLCKPYCPHWREKELWAGAKDLERQLIIIIFYCTNMFSLNKIYLKLEVEITKKNTHAQFHHFMKCTFESLFIMYLFFSLSTHLLIFHLPIYIGMHVFTYVCM